MNDILQHPVLEEASRELACLDKPVVLDLVRFLMMAILSSPFLINSFVYPWPGVIPLQHQGSGGQVRTIIGAFVFCSYQAKGLVDIRSSSNDRIQVSKGAKKQYTKLEILVDPWGEIMLD